VPPPPPPPHPLPPLPTARHVLSRTHTYTYVRQTLKRVLLAGVLMPFFFGSNSLRSLNCQRQAVGACHVCALVQQRRVGVCCLL
jgi:hypothetical protein